jgi:hypothetical protein
VDASNVQSVEHEQDHEDQTKDWVPEYGAGAAEMRAYRRESSHSRGLLRRDEMPGAPYYVSNERNVKPLSKGMAVRVMQKARRQVVVLTRRRHGGVRRMAPGQAGMTLGDPRCLETAPEVRVWLRTLDVLAKHFAKLGSARAGLARHGTDPELDLDSGEL